MKTMPELVLTAVVNQLTSTGGTLTLSPTTGLGVVDVSIALAHANTWSGSQTFYSSGLLLNNPANTFAYTFVGAAIAASHNITLPLLTGSDTMAVLGFAQTWTAAQTFYSSDFLINNPANTFAYTFVGAAIGASHDITLPLLTGNDTMAVLGFAQTFTATQTFHEIDTATDATYAIGTTTNRWTSVHAQNFQVEAASGDANPTAKLTNGALYFGAGGASALDIEINRTGSTTLTMTAGTFAFGNTGISIGGASYDITKVTALATGDIVFYDGTNWINLAVGVSTSYVLGVSAGKPSWVTFSSLGGVSAPQNIYTEYELPDVASHNIATYTPSAAGNLMLMVYYRVTVGATNVTLTATWTDQAGAQSYSWMSAVSNATGSYSVLPLFINSAASQPVTIAATAGTANQVYTTASIMLM
jgi:hypothetical protein